MSKFAEFTGKGIRAIREGFRQAAEAMVAADTARAGATSQIFSLASQCVELIRAHESFKDATLDNFMTGIWVHFRDTVIKAAVEDIDGGYASISARVGELGRIVAAALFQAEELAAFVAGREGIDNIDAFRSTDYAEMRKAGLGPAARASKFDADKVRARALRTIRKAIDEAVDAGLDPRIMVSALTEAVIHAESLASK